MVTVCEFLNAGFFGAVWKGCCSLQGDRLHRGWSAARWAVCSELLIQLWLITLLSTLTAGRILGLFRRIGACLLMYVVGLVCSPCFLRLPFFFLFFFFLGGGGGGGWGEGAGVGMHFVIVTFPG